MYEGKTAVFKYKCRLCGEVFSNGDTSGFNGFRLLVHAALDVGYIDDLIGSAPGMVDLHYDCKKGIGVGDLIGVEMEDE